MLKGGGGRGRWPGGGGGLICEACRGFPRVAHKHILWVLQMMVKLQLIMFLNKIYFTIQVIISRVL